METTSVLLFDLLSSKAHVRLVRHPHDFSNPEGSLVFACCKTMNGLEVVRSKDGVGLPLYFDSETVVGSSMEVKDYSGNLYKVEVTFPEVGVELVSAYLKI